MANMHRQVLATVAVAVSVGLAGCVTSTNDARPDTAISQGGYVQDRCASAVAREAGVRASDVVVTRSTISEGTGLHVVYVGVPRATADWVCEARSDGTVVNVFFGGEG
jgi:hypothetical protein